MQFVRTRPPLGVDLANKHFFCSRNDRQTLVSELNESISGESQSKRAVTCHSHVIASSRHHVTGSGGKRAGRESPTQQFTLNFGCVTKPVKGE